MKITSEKSLVDFEAWSGAVDTKNSLTDEQMRTIESSLEEAYPDGMDETDLNDFLWFDRDTIAEWLDFTDWEHLTGEEEDEDEEE